jgi:hypothetical protein
MGKMARDISAFARIAPLESTDAPVRHSQEQSDIFRSHMLYALGSPARNEKFFRMRRRRSLTAVLFCVDNKVFYKREKKRIL